MMTHSTSRQVHPQIRPRTTGLSLLTTAIRAIFRLRKSFRPGLVVLLLAMNSVGIGMAQPNLPIAGQEAVIIRKTTVRSGSNILGSVDVGFRFTIQTITDKWVAGTFQVDGKFTQGWVDHQCVRSVEQPQEPPDSPVARQTKDPAVRSRTEFSDGQAPRFVLQQLSSDVETQNGKMSLSGNGARLVFPGGNTVQVIDTARGRVLREIQSPNRKLCSSPQLNFNGTVVTFLSDGALFIFDVETGTLLFDGEKDHDLLRDTTIYNYAVHDSLDVLLTEVNINGKFIALFLDLSGRELRRISLEGSIISQTPELSRLLCDSRPIQIVDGRTGRMLRTLSPAGYPSVRYTDDSQRMAFEEEPDPVTESGDQVLTIVDLKSGDSIARFRIKANGIADFGFLDRETIWFCIEDSDAAYRTVFRNLSTSRDLHTIRSQHPVSVKPLKNGKEFILVHELSATFEHWSCGNPFMRSGTFPSESHDVWNHEFDRLVSYRKGRIAIGENAKTGKKLTCSNPSTGETLGELTGNGSPLSAAWFSADGTFEMRIPEIGVQVMMSRITERGLESWTSTMGMKSSPFHIFGPDAHECALSPNGEMLLICQQGGRVIDVRTAEIIRQFEHTRIFTGAFSADGSRVALLTGGDQGLNISVHAIGKQEAVAEFNLIDHPKVGSGTGSPRFQMQFSGNEDFLFVRSDGDWLDVYGLGNNSGSRVYSSFDIHNDLKARFGFEPDTGHTAAISSAMIAFDGKSDSDAAVVLYPLDDFSKPIHVRLPTESPIMAAGFADRNEILLVCHADGKCHLIDGPKGVILRQIVGPSAVPTACRVLRNGNFLVSYANHISAYFDVHAGKAVLYSLTLWDSGDFISWTPEGLFDGTANARRLVTYRIGEGIDVVPVDRFFQDFYYPGLLAAIWRGERPVPEIQLGDQLPPLLKINSPERGGEVEDRCVTLTVTAMDQGGGIKGPSIRHNGATLIGAVRSTERIEGGVRRTFSVDLIESENTLDVVSASADGSFESEPARIVLRYGRPLPKSRLHVLVVGVDTYAEPSLKLNFSVSDADQIAKVFADRGGNLYEDINVVALRNVDATSNGILGAIESLAKVARPQDTVVAFLSGHGAVVDRNFYFLPHDFRRKGETLEDDIRRFGLPANDIGGALAQVPALKRMIVFDTGQSGGALPVRNSSRDPFAFRGAIERLGRAQGAFTIASAATSDEAHEVEELGHGILSYSLLAGLRAVDSGPLVDEWVQPVADDRVAQALELFSFASSRARQLGKRYFGQEQEIQFSSAGMTFPVLPIADTGKPRIARHEKTQPTTSPATLSLGSASPPASISRSTLHVVVVGINDYAESSMHLKFAAPDASAIGELLRHRSNDVIENVHVTQLLNAQATRQGILAAIQDVATKARPDDTLAVFLAGHGTMVGQRYYFIPADFRSDAGTTEENVRKNALPADELGDAIAMVSASRRMLILDTCASGGAIHLNRQGDDPFAFRGAIEQLGKDGGTFTLAAVGSTEEAHEVKELGHGILTYSLLAAAQSVENGPLLDRPLLPSAAAGVADVLEWFSYAAGNVPRLTKQYFGKEQQVQIGGRGTAFPVLKCSEATRK